ncbi:MAG: hypothetical protein HYY46_26155 [Deltaproteobacteria bacterium]|nr:hypothetical protein [Deltaproteobacteria bacterium]
MDLATVLFLLSPFLGLLACMFVHVLVSRTAPALPCIRGVVSSLLGGLVVVIGMALTLARHETAWTAAADWWGALLVCVITYLRLA